MKSTRASARRPATLSTLALIAVLSFSGCGSDLNNTSAPQANQMNFGFTTLKLLTVDGLNFKDMNKDGVLQPYEDWRLSPDVRAKDLVSRLTLQEKAGLMMHGTAPALNDTTGIGTGTAYDPTALSTLINKQGVSTFITRLSADANALAAQYNELQKVAEQSRLGIPVTISSDPRNHFQYVLGASASANGFSQWPEPLGLAAIGDAGLTKTFGDIARQEYRAVGITEALSPQADLATEPRWPRINGTFGEDAQAAKAQVRAYIEGFQKGDGGINSDSVIAVVKHWAGYGAQKSGFDSHNYYGRYATYPKNNFPYHLIPFEGAFAAKVGAVMPTYSEPDGSVTVDGISLEQVGAAFDKPLLTDLLRGKYGFDGVIVSDWQIASDCDTNCMNGWGSAHPGFVGLGMPWGMESATRLQRFVRAVGAGVDQFGGEDDPSFIVQAVNQGLLTQSRLDESAYRVLLQKFQQGLFDHPYVDASAASSIVGKQDFQSQALDAQRRSMVPLQNSGDLLPMATGKKVWLYGIDPSVAKQYGYTVVTSPQAADVAIVRASTPFETLHPTYTFGSMQHEGSLAFVDGNPDYEAIKQAALAPKSVVAIYMDRPAILTNVQPKVTSILANFGASDVALFDVLTGKGKPEGHLPLELPSSMADVATQSEDLPHDTAHPLYPYGFGLSYK